MLSPEKPTDSVGELKSVRGSAAIGRLGRERSRANGTWALRELWYARLRMLGVRLRHSIDPARTESHLARCGLVLALVASIRPCHAAPDEVESPRVAEPAPTADPDLDERAQRHWGSGMAYLDEGDYPRALDAFTKAYELSGRARILLAIAVTHERRGDLQSAVETLEEYLRLSPTAPNAPSIEAHRDELRLKHAAELERIRAAKQSEGQAPSPDDVDETNGARESPSKERLPGSGHDRSPRASTLEWTALGIGVASGVAAAVSGVMAWQKREEVAEGCGATRSCSRDATQPGRTMAWVSTALTGVSVVGLGLGIWLALDGPNGADDSKLTAGSGFTVDVNYSPRALTSEVTWSF